MMQQETETSTTADGPFPVTPRERWSVMAIAAMIASLAWVFWIGTVVGLVLAHVAWSQMNRDPWLRGRGLVITAFVAGYIGVLTLVTVLVSAAIGG